MLIEFLLNFVLGVMQQLGYLGVFVLMFLESTMAPVPSELVMPFAGFLAAKGAFNFWIVVLAATLGSILGSLFSYWIGKTLEQGTILKIGKFFFINKHDFELAHKWFEKYGAATIFVCRFIPAIRHVISIPAGFAEMNLKKFLVFTAAGAFLWNLFLAYTGVLLKENWKLIGEYFSVVDIFVVAVVILAAIFIIYKKTRKTSNN